MSYRDGGSPALAARQCSPIGVGRAVVPNARTVAVTDRLGLGYATYAGRPLGFDAGGNGDGLGFDAGGNGDGLGNIFDDVKNALTPIVGPAIAAGVSEFNRRATGALLQTPGVQGALVQGAATQGQVMFQTAAPWLVGGLLLLLVMRR